MHWIVNSKFKQQLLGRFNITKCFFGPLWNSAVHRLPNAINPINNDNKDHMTYQTNCCVQQVKSGFRWYDDLFSLFILASYLLLYAKNLFGKKNGLKQDLFKNKHLLFSIYSFSFFFLKLFFTSVFVTVLGNICVCITIPRVTSLPDVV